MSNRFLFYAFIGTVLLYVGLWVMYFDQINNYLVFTTSFVFVIVYFFLLISTDRFIKYKSQLFVFFSVTLLLFTGIFNAIYIDHRGDNFEFTGSDSTTYERYSTQALDYEYFEGIEDFVRVSKYGYDDAGMIAYLTFLYRIIQDPLFPRFINVIIGILTFLILFNLAKSCLGEKTAMIASLMYGAASYNVYHISSGLKETIFTFFVVLAFYCYYRFKEKGDLKFLIYTILSIAVTIFFRIPVTLFLTLSLVSAELITRKKTPFVWGLIITFSLVVIGFFGLYFNILGQYLHLIRAVSYKDESGLSGGAIYQILNVVSAFFGPFPTIPATSGHEADSLWAASQVLKVFVSIYFLYGIYFTFKGRNSMLTAGCMYCLLLIISLILIKDTFKLRYIMPYLPLFFIVAAHGYEKIKENAKYVWLNRMVLPVNLGLFLFIILWNMLRL